MKKLLYIFLCFCLVGISIKKRGILESNYAEILESKFRAGYINSR